MPAETQPIVASVQVNPKVAVPKVPIGVGTIFTLGVAVAGGVGAYIAGLDGNDTLAATGAAASVVAAVGTLGARAAQVIALARLVAHYARPIVDALDDPDAAA